MRVSSQQLYAKVVECARVADECSSSLIKAFDASIRAQNDYIDAVSKYKKEADAEQAQWAESMATIEQAHEKRATEVVTLDVGGVIFRTRVETLSKYPLSYFGVYTSGRWNLSETAFIDRDPELFRYVMAYLRHDTLQLCDIGPELRKALVAEAEYYVLPELKTLMMPAPIKEKIKPSIYDWAIAMPNRKEGESQDRLTHTNLNSQFQCARGTRRWSTGVHEWSVSGDKLYCKNIIGVMYAPASFTLSHTDRLHNTGRVFGINTDDGFNSHSAIKNQCVFGENFAAKSNDVFNIRLDLDSKTITFGRNGVWNEKPTYTLGDWVKDGIWWHPYFDIWEPNTSLWLVK